MKTVVEIHVLQNFAPSNLNRDDTGAPKDAWFGGTRRARVSSQCSKRAVREYFRLQNAHWVASRTKRLVDELSSRMVKRLAEQNDVDAAAVSKAVATAVGCLGSSKKVKVDKDRKTDVLLFISPKEIDALSDAIYKHIKALGTEKIPDAVVKDLNSALDDDESRSRLSVDVALFGRMLAVMPEKNQYAACQVAHAISTHAVEREFDFYTAVDDLKPEDTTGADMMGTVEFNSACFYRYATVDWDKLNENLQGDGDLPVKGLRAFLEGFVVAEPTGKQNSFAAHNAPEFVLILVRRDTAPRNLANAFETAVRARENLTKVSAEKLIDKAVALQQAYGGKSDAWALSLVDASVDGYALKKDSLPELLDAVMANVRGS
jgi:CRISPR system Cascade subunit CasC